MMHVRPQLLALLSTYHSAHVTGKPSGMALAMRQLGSCPEPSARSSRQLSGGSGVLLCSSLASRVPLALPWLILGKQAGHFCAWIERHWEWQFPIAQDVGSTSSWYTILAMLPCDGCEPLWVSRFAATVETPRLRDTVRDTLPLSPLCRASCPVCTMILAEEE